MFIWIIVLLVLFVLVQRNNKRNMAKLRNSKSRGFKKSYYQRRNEHPYRKIEASSPIDEIGTDDNQEAR